MHLMLWELTGADLQDQHVFGSILYFITLVTKP